MPANFHIDKDKGIVVGHAEGVVQPAELIAAFSKLAQESNGLSVGMPMLFKADEQASHHAMNMGSLKSVADNMRAWRASAHVTARVKNALVAPDLSHDPVASLWRALADADPSVGIIVRVFATEEAAIAWLTEHDT